MEARSAFHPGLARRLTGAVLVISVAGTVLVGFAGAALAAANHSEPPYALCNVAIGKSASNIMTTIWRCTYDLNGAGAGSGVTIYDVSAAMTGGNTGTIFGPGGYSVTCPGGTGCTTDSGGLFEFTSAASGGPYGPCVTGAGAYTVGTVNTGSASTKVVFSNATGTGVAVEIGTITQSCGAPAWPTDWFDGTGPPGSETRDVSTPVATCTRVLTLVGTTATAAFKTGNTLPGAEATDTYAWVYGDGSTNGTTRNPKHTYTYADMPTGGWTATVTLTRTPATGHAFSDGVTTARTATCSLRVDFDNPSESDPLTTEPVDDTDCPTSGLGWLNPFAIVTILKCLFVPQHFGEDFGDMYDAAQSNWPFGPLLFAVNVIVQGMTGFRDGAAAAADAPNHDTGSYNGCPATSVTVDQPDNPFTGGLPLPIFCEDESAGTFGATMRIFTRVMFYVGGGFAVFRIVTGSMGSGSDEGGEE